MPLRQKLETIAREIYGATEAGSIASRRTLDGEAWAPYPGMCFAIDEDGASVGVVGQGAKAFVRVSRPRGKLTVKWGSSNSAMCRMRYRATAALS